jgi:hypothetical protein
MVETDGTFESFAGILVEEQRSRGSLMHKQKLHHCEISQLVYSSNSKTLSNSPASSRRPRIHSFGGKLKGYNPTTTTPKHNGFLKPSA